jgi:hypothetical protein
VQTHASRRGFVPNTRNHHIRIGGRSIEGQKVPDMLWEMLESTGVSQDKK